MLPVGESHAADARRVSALLAEEGFRVEVDDRSETLGKRVRDAELEKVPFAITYGDRESDDALAIRERGGEQYTESLEALLARFREAASL